MADHAIEVCDLGKKYQLGEHEPYKALRDILAGFFTGSGKRDRNAQDLWAIKDVSFNVGTGEVLGIIGRNGAGKSTLLKLLSRITTPTVGEAILRGRVGSLLEVGTGFHPELTGRENVFLSGAILGMSRREIVDKFDEIVDFAGVERFLETPVKRYSSGMYVRLAFAVAAHLEPEVLVIDEVLAVGDVEFQKKCLGKMQSIAGGGRTVLFVSHNMTAVSSLCSRAILLEGGRLVKDGPAVDVVKTYLEGSLAAGGAREWEADEAPGGEDLRMVSVKLVRTDGSPAAVIEVGEQAELQIRYQTLEPRLRFRCSVGVFTQGVCAFSTIEPGEEERSEVGEYTSTVTFPAHFFAEGEHTISIALTTLKGEKKNFAEVRDVVVFQVIDPMDGDSARGDYVRHLGGVVRPKLRWTLQDDSRKEPVILQER